MYKEKFNLTGRTAFVTGSTSGIIPYRARRAGNMV